MQKKIKEYATFVKYFADEATESAIKLYEEKKQSSLPSSALPSLNEVIRNPKGAKAITPKKAVKIVFFLMAADGEIRNDENEEYVEIARALYESFDSVCSEIENECMIQIQKAHQSNDFFSTLLQSLKQLLNEPITTTEGYIPANLFLWNMLAISYSDNCYSSEEEKLIKYVANYMDIDKSVFLEFEGAIKTIIKLDEEKDKLKAIGRSHLSVDSFVKHMDEIENRKRTILRNIKGLLASKGE